MKQFFTKKIILCFLIASFIFSNFSSFGEGTKQIRPAESDFGFLVNDANWSKFSLYGCPSTSRLNIKICNIGEKFYYGFKQTDNDIEYRIKDPNGNIVVGPAILPSSGAGRIDDHAHAIAGPQQIVGGTGYNALSYTPLMTGDYFIEFKDLGARRTFELFDITVATSGNVALLGRIWSQAWMFSADSYTNQFKGKLYIYSDDKIVTSLNFNGMQPYVFVVSANPTGTQNTNNFFVDRMSVKGLSTYPQYKIFLNDPDISCFPTGSFGNVSGPITIQGCGPKKIITIPVDTPGNILLTLNLNGVAGYQPGTADRQFFMPVVVGNNTLEWDTRDGLGNLVASGTNVDMQIDFLNGLTNLPLYDVETHSNGYIVQLVRPAGSAPKLFWDDTNIPSGTTNLAGCNSPCHTWTWGGSDNAAVDYGNRNTINTWWYANIRNASAPFTVNLINVDVNRLNPDGASNDTTVCSNSPTMPIHPIVNGFTTTGVWKTLTGGTFNQALTTLDGTYTFSATEKSNGIAKLVLTSTNNGTCPAVTDTLNITIIPGPIVDAGPAQSICKSSPEVTLAGSVSGSATTGKWSNGGGSFVTKNTKLTAKYTPSSGEKTAGFVKLYLTSTNGSGTCPAAKDSVVITYTSGPTVTPGSAISKCKNNPKATLAASVTNATSQVWSGGEGTFSDINSPTSTYIPTQAELDAGSVTLTLTATLTGCGTATGTVKITYTASPTAFASDDQSICKNKTDVTLDGSVTGVSGGTWSAVGGGGTFAPNALKGTFKPSSTQLSAGSVKLVLTTTDASSNCNMVTDTMKITFTPAPTVDVSAANTTVCANKPEATLNGIVMTGATKGHWTKGCGTYVLNDNMGNGVKYTPCSTEISAHSAGLIFTTTDHASNCNSAQDTVLIVISPAPTADAGSTQTICGTSQVTLAGLATGTFAWSSAGGGVFTNVNSLTSKYTPSANEVSAGFATLTLTSNITSPASCTAVSSQVRINIDQVPTADAGGDQSVCANNPAVTLNGSATNETTHTWVGGGGTFNPNRNTLNAIYTPLASEISAGSVILTMKADKSGCTSATNSMTISFTAAPTVDAGTYTPVCKNNSTIQLAGTVSLPATQGTWTGGAGNFVPNRNVLNPTYEPTSGELSTGVTLTLKTTDHGNCSQVSDPATITFTNSPTVNAGATQTVCEDNPTVTLNGSVTVATQGIWTGGNGTFTPDNTTLNAQYKPTDAEVSLGIVTLKLTTTNNSNCNAVDGTTTIKYNHAPTVYAGPSQTICKSTGTVQLDGKKTVATGSTWSTSGSGTFNNASLLNAVYTPSGQDKIDGTVTLTLKTTGSGSCAEVSDFMTVQFTSVPTINAGPDQTVCTNEFPVLLNATGSPATWSAGSGTFSNVNDLNATYTPAIASGNVTLTLTTIAAGACPSISSSVIITVLPKPVPNAGGPQTICGNTASIALNGTVVNPPGNGGFWTTNGLGTFSPNAGTVGASYVPTAAESASGATIINTLTTTPNAPCPSEKDQMTLTILPKVVVDPGPAQTFCADVNSYNLAGTVTPQGTGVWSKVSANGTIGNVNNLSTTYAPDATDKTNGTVTLRLTSTGGNASCPIVSKDITFTITPSPTANAGAPQTICADSISINLAGVPTLPATDGKWTTTGTGVFSPSAATSVTKYFPTAADTTAHTVTFTYTTTTGNGTCAAATSQMVLTISPKPIVSAGSNITVCKDVVGINLNGKVLHAGGGKWTTSGSGTFSNANILNPVYTPSANDLKGGTITLTLESTTNGSCDPVKSLMIVTFIDAPVPTAGPNKTVCATATSIALNGNVTGATGGTWTGGFGSFSNANLAATNYLPVSADTTAGSVTLTLTTTGNGQCTGTYQASTTITFDHKPIVEAGSPYTVCADSAYINLNGSVANATGGTWSTNGNGGFSLNNTKLTGKYVFNSTDKNLGTLKLILTSSGSSSCSPVKDSTTVTFTTAPTVTVGKDTTICADATSLQLSGSFTIASGVKWTTSGNGTFANNTDPNTTYTPSANDKSAGTVILTLTTTGNGNCKSTAKSLTLKITPIPVPNAGSNETVCKDKESISLNGTVSGATGGTWTSTGNGGFDPNANTLNATYYITDNDRAAGTITLTLTTTGNGTCAAVAKNKVITFINAPTVEAGPSDTICADASGVNLNGTSSTTTGTWVSRGVGGSFAPNNTALNAQYIPSASDKSNGSVILVLTTSGNGICNAVSDSLKVIITPTPTVDAGADFSACADIEFITLSGSVTNADGGKWTTDGTGTFTPTDTDLNAEYSPTAADFTSGMVTLTLTSTGNGTCNAVSKNKILTFSQVPHVDAGTNITACIGGGAIQLNPTFTSGSGFWHTSALGTFTPNANTPTATYTPDPSEEVNGNSIKLYFTGTGTGACSQITDSLTITFSPAPSISAGPNKSVCQTDLPVQLEGTGSNGVWTSPGGLGSFSPNANTLNATFTPDPSQIGTVVTLTLTRPASGGCPADVKTVDLNIKSGGPVVDAGTPITACVNATAIPLGGSFSGATTVKWTTASGTGSFSSDSDPNATFTPSAFQINAGIAHLTLTTVGALNGCNNKADQVDIILGPAPTVDAGLPQDVCASTSTISLSATKTVAAGVTWSIVPGFGAGTFTNGNTLTPTYNRVQADTLAGSVKLRVTTTGGTANCPDVSDDVTVSFKGSPTAVAGANSSHCADVTQVTLNGLVPGATGGSWSTSGTGTFTPNTSTLNATYIPSDADKTGSVTLTLATSGTGSCSQKTSDRILTFTAKPNVNAGITQEFCSDQATTTLAGSFSGGAGGIKWTTTGTGGFDSDVNPTAVYTPSAQDKLNGGVNLTMTSTGSAPCQEVQSFVTLIIHPAPTSSVFAGNDQEVCKDAKEVQLQGIITIASGAKWTKVSGTGSFFPNDSTLDAKYLPTSADTTAGSVQLRLTTTTGNGICAPGSDDVMVTFTNTPKVTFTVPANACGDVTSVVLTGNVTVASGGVWSTSGSGTFAPNEFTLNASYFPSAADIANGSVGLTLTSSGNGTCNAGSTSKALPFAKAPTAFAGNDKLVCSDASTISLVGTTTSAPIRTWTTSGTGTFNNANSLTPIYTPSAADIASTRINLTLTTTGPGTCNQVKDQIRIDFTPAPTVDAGPATTICADATGLSLNGKITVATGAVWSTSGNGTFTPNSTALNATYVPSQNDKTAGSVTLTLTTTGNGTCNAVDSTKAVTIDAKPTVNPGPAVSCAFTNGAILNGVVTHAAGGLWSTSGSGVFSSSAAITNPTYFPSVSDISAGGVTLTLTSTGNGTCNAVASSSTLIVSPLPVAEAGGDQFVCTGSSVTLIAQPSSNVDYAWTNNGGANIGNNSSVTVSVPANTFVVLSVTDGKGCNSKDTVRLNTYTLPTLTLPPHACLSDTLVLDAQPTNMPVVPGEFQWFRTNTLLPGENDFTLVVRQTGIHTIRWSYGSSQCVVTQSTNVTAPPVLKTVDSIYACENSTATLTTVSNPSAGITYAWTKGITPVGGNAATITDSPIATGLTTYYVKATDALTCFAIDSIKVTGIPVPQFTLVDQTVCQNSPLVLNGVPTDPTLVALNPVYQWQKDRVVQTGITTSTFTVNTATAGTFEYVVKATIDQCFGTDTSNVLINPQPADNLPADTRFCIDTDKQIVLDAGAGANLTYQWTNPSGPVVTTQKDTVYTKGLVYLTVTNTLTGCFRKDSILVKDICMPKIFVPTAFSPNGNGTNDHYGVFGNPDYFKNFKMTIFNRWGEIIFYTEDPAETWDGNYRGDPMPIGVYAWLITYEGNAPEFAGPYKLQGSVTIVR